VTGEAVDLAEDGDEGLLGGIEGRVAVAQHAQADGEDAILMGAHEIVEGADVAPQVTLDEGGVGVASFAHRPNATGSGAGRGRPSQEIR
jgi:hypothetical protein